MSEATAAALVTMTVMLSQSAMAAAEAFVYDHVRTPRGKGKAAGSLHEVKPVDLVVGLIHEIEARNPSLDTERIDDVVLGIVTPVADQGGDLAKTAALPPASPRPPPGSS